MQRIVLLVLGVIVGSLSVPVPSEAQFSSGRNPWCMRDGRLRPGKLGLQLPQPATVHRKCDWSRRHLSAEPELPGIRQGQAT